MFSLRFRYARRQASRLVLRLNVCCLRCVSLHLGTGVDGIDETELEHPLRLEVLLVLIGTHMNGRAWNCHDNPVAVSQDKDRQRCNILCMSVSCPQPPFACFLPRSAASSAGIPALSFVCILVVVWFSIPASMLPGPR